MAANDNFYSTGTNNVNNAFNTGNSAINSFDPSGFSKSVTQGQNSLYGVGGAQNNQMNDYIQSYKNAVSANPSVTSLYNTGNDMFNVPGLQNEANSLNNAVLQAPSTVRNSARGFNFDNNQVQNQTNLDLMNLTPLAAAATNNANTAEQNASNYVQAGITQNNMNLMPVQTEGQQLQQQWAEQATGFDANSKNTLDALTAKMQAGVQLSQSEMSAYTQLAQMEENYQSMVGETGAAITQAQLGNQYKVIPAGNTMVNTFNGATYRAR